MQLEKQLKEKAQVEEEVKMYRDQCYDLMEQLSAFEAAPPPPPSASPSPRARAPPTSAGAPSPSASSMWRAAQGIMSRQVEKISNELNHGGQ